MRAPVQNTPGEGGRALLAGTCLPSGNASRLNFDQSRYSFEERWRPPARRRKPCATGLHLVVRIQHPLVTCTRQSSSTSVAARPGDARSAAIGQDVCGDSIHDDDLH